MGVALCNSHLTPKAMAKKKKKNEIKKKQKTSAHLHPGPIEISLHITFRIANTHLNINGHTRSNTASDSTQQQFPGD